MKIKGTPSKNHNTKNDAVRRIRIISIDEIFDFIRNNPYEMYYIDPFGNRSKVRRAKVFFEKGITCIQDGCKLVGDYFALDVWPDGSFHLDLFAIDEQGDEVMMTIDHIVPKSKGGEDHIRNYQTMCKVCNELKSNIIILLIAIFIYGCKGNSDADYISGFRDIKRFAKQYADSVNKESHKIDSLKMIGK